MGYESYRGRRSGGWGKRLSAACLALLLAAVAAFGALLGVVLAGGHNDLRGDPQVMVILGCQVRADGPSILLRDRLDTALDYLADHPDLTVVVSGGQGSDEHTSEAQAMYDYLVDHGVDGAQILLEDSSHNTAQNLRYTQAVLQEAGYDAADGVVLVSSGFHLARARMLWSRVWGGNDELSTLAAPASHLPSRLLMYVREPLALVKSFLFD